MDAAKLLPRAFDTLINTIKTDQTSTDVVKTDQMLPGLIKTDPAFSGGERSNAPAPGDDIVAAGAISIGEIEKLIEELGTARDYLRSEGERVRRVNARYSHLTRTASASVKIITESMGKWHTTEMETTTGADSGLKIVPAE